MKKPDFKSPAQYKKDQAKVVISSRVPQKCKDALDWAAKSSEMGVSELVAGILEDYSEWLMQEYMKQGKRVAEKYK